ncbi:LysR family transcriptional regulator [Sphingomonas bacterium]|uniref:LysR family transcriptional regulator n=1 Tax=Sphingomonas bacterium TaxID=1895847 RepID=UPI001575A05D|nr:LysR family transcriptional regulator [Sphingomonas bacterium]
MSELDWDHLRIFIHVARTGRLSVAAERLKLNHSTVARRMSVLEESIGTRLFDRSPQGVTLTNEGTELLVYAERIEHEAHSMLAHVAGQETLLSGVVRIAVPEAFGCFLVAPALDQFQAEHPEITIELIPESRHVSLSRRDADLIVSTVRPRRGRMFINKLAEFKMGLYASPAYLERRGTPVNAGALATHDFVGFIEDLLDTDDYAPLDQIVENPRLAFRSSSIVSQQSAIAAGIGLGLLHSFAARYSPGIRQILVDEVGVRRAYWLLVHADLRRIPRIRAVIRFLQQLVGAAGSARMLESAVPDPAQTEGGSLGTSSTANSG